MLVWTSPATFLAKHWNIPVSSGRSPLTCRLPPTRTRYRGIFTGSMGWASLYQTMSGWGTPATGRGVSQGHLTGSGRGRGISPRAWQGMSTTFSISAVMCRSGSFMNCGGSEEQRRRKKGKMRRWDVDEEAGNRRRLCGVRKTVGAQLAAPRRVLTAPCPFTHITTFSSIKDSGMKAPWCGTAFPRPLIHVPPPRR